jgi:hypothetical protein
MASTPIQEYIDKHGLQKRVEDVLNSCVQAKPADPLAFMVRGPAAGRGGDAVGGAPAARCSASPPHAGARSPKGPPKSWINPVRMP